MGKKSRKKKTGKTTVPSSSSADANSWDVPLPAGTSAAATAEAADAAAKLRDGSFLPAGVTLAGAEVTAPSGCFHGSKLSHFKKLEYMMAIPAYIRMRSDIREIQSRQHNPLALGQRSQQFDDEYKHLLLDKHFCRFIFAYCTHLYKRGYHSSVYVYDKGEVDQLLSLGIRLRYQDQAGKGVHIGPGSDNYDKWHKYNRDIHTERGVINVLAREIPCGCMDPQKVEGKKMEKINHCYGCKNTFPKSSLSTCTGCHAVQYCSKDCQVNEWPTHRDVCKLYKSMHNFTSDEYNRS